jgi:3-oxoacyl-[acyl-carrier-protein] synthase-3
MKTPIEISGVGLYLPKKVLSNAELSTRVDTSDEWIVERVGIKARHVAHEEETNLFMSHQAGQMALERANLKAADLDLIIVATATPDRFMPSVACQLAANLGASCAAFDINAACSGFVYAMHIAKQFFDAGTAKNILIVGSELMSRIMDWSDRRTCVLFGDGAGAVILSQGTQSNFIASEIFADGRYADLLNTTAHFRVDPFEGEMQSPKLTMEGNKVFRFAVETLEHLVEHMLVQNQLDKTDIDWLVPHQANARIITATAKKLDLPMDKVIVTLTTQGNTTAASIPLALATGVLDGRIKRGNLLLLEAFGAGFVWGANLIRY